jgi:hypothetical protein
VVVHLGVNLGNADCSVLPVEDIGLDAKAGPRIMRYELTDFEWNAIRSFLPNKPRGIPHVTDLISFAAVGATGARGQAPTDAVYLPGGAKFCVSQWSMMTDHRDDT